jgi:hypothetical protein
MGEIADGDIHAIAVARSGRFQVTDENPRPIAALEEALNDAGPNVSGRACDEIDHGSLPSKNTVFKWLQMADGWLSS